MHYTCVRAACLYIYISKPEIRERGGVRWKSYIEREERTFSTVFMMGEGRVSDLEAQKRSATFGKIEFSNA